MFLYWLMFSIFAVGSFGKLRQATSTRYSPVFLAAMVFLIFFIGLRYEVGGDWKPYLLIYDAARDAGWGDIISQNDPAYLLLNRFSGSFDGELWPINLVCAAIFGWGLARFANDQPDPWLAVLVALPYLIIVVGMGYTRQSVAIGLMLLGISSFQRHRYLAFFVCMAFAASFHKTVVVMIPLIALSTMRHRFVVWATAAALGSAIFLFFISTVLDAMLDNYVTQAMKSDGAGIRIAMTAAPALLYLIFQRRFIIDEAERILWRNFALASLLTVVGLALSASSTIVDRVSLYLIPLQIIVLSRLPLAFPRSGQRNGLLLTLVVAYSASIQLIWLLFASHADAWVPYYNYFTKN